ILLAAPALWLFVYGSALISRRNGYAVVEEPVRQEPVDADSILFESEDEDDENEGILALGAVTHWWLSLRAWMRRRSAARRRDYGEFDLPMEPQPSAWRRAAERVESAERAQARRSLHGRARVDPQLLDGARGEGVPAPD